jgi:hypothetical protein
MPRLTLSLTLTRQLHTSEGADYLSSISSPEAFSILKTFGSISATDSLMQGHNLAVRIWTKFGFSADLLPSPEFECRQFHSPILFSHAVFCE